MKNVVLASLLLLGISNAFGAEIEKGGISIKYELCRTVKMDYRSTLIGLPYCVTIANHSSTPIVVDSSLIKASLYSLNEIAKAMRSEYKMAILPGIIATPTLGYGSYLVLKDMGGAHTFRPPTVYPFSFGTIGKGTSADYIILGATIVVGSLTAYLLYKLIKGTEKIFEAKLKKDVLYSPITIQPGKSVEKLFWPKSPKDQIKIDFDAIKVLK